jgi:hypothetical protein
MGGITISNPDLSQSILDASNGLTKNGSDVELGGVLTQNTNIVTGGFFFAVDGTPVGGAVTAENGLSIQSDGSVGLGGSLSENTDISLSTKSLTFGAFSGGNNLQFFLQNGGLGIGTFLLQLSASGFSAIIEAVNNGPASSFRIESQGTPPSGFSAQTKLNQNPGGMQLVLIDIATGLQQGLIFDNHVPVELNDDFLQFGLKYSADYSVNGSLDPLWLPNLGAVKKIFIASSANIDNQNATVNILTYPVVDDQAFTVGGFINVSAVTVGTVVLSVSYTDISGNPQTVPLGAAIASIGDSAYPSVVINAQDGTNISIDATVTGTITYNAGGYATSLFPIL